METSSQGMAPPLCRQCQCSVPGVFGDNSRWVLMSRAAAPYVKIIGDGVQVDVVRELKPVLALDDKGQEAVRRAAEESRIAKSTRARPPKGFQAAGANASLDSDLRLPKAGRGALKAGGTQHGSGPDKPLPGGANATSDGAGVSALEPKERPSQKEGEEGPQATTIAGRVCAVKSVVRVDTAFGLQGVAVEEGLRLPGGPAAQQLNEVLVVTVVPQNLGGTLPKGVEVPIPSLPVASSPPQETEPVNGPTAPGTEALLQQPHIGLSEASDGKSLSLAQGDARSQQETHRERGEPVDGTSEQDKKDEGHKQQGPAQSEGEGPGEVQGECRKEGLEVELETDGTAAVEEQTLREVAPQTAALFAALARLGDEEEEEEAARGANERPGEIGSDLGGAKETLGVGKKDQVARSGVVVDSDAVGEGQGEPEGLAGQERTAELTPSERVKLRKIAADAAERRAAAARLAKPRVTAPLPGMEVAAGGKRAGQPVANAGEVEVPLEKPRHKDLRKEIKKRSLLGAFDSVRELEVVPGTPSQDFVPVPSDAQRPEDPEELDGCASVRSKERKEEPDSLAQKLALVDVIGAVGQGSEPAIDNDDALQTEGAALAKALPSQTRTGTDAPLAAELEVPSAPAHVGCGWRSTIPNRSPPGSSVRLSGQEWGALHKSAHEQVQPAGVPSGDVTGGGGLPLNSSAGAERYPKPPETVEPPLGEQTGLWATAKVAPLLGSPSESVEPETKFGGLARDPPGRGYPSSQEEDEELDFVAETPESQPGYWPQKRRLTCLQDDGGKRVKLDRARGLPFEKEGEMLGATPGKGVSGRGLHLGPIDGADGRLEKGGLRGLDDGQLGGEDLPTVTGAASEAILQQGLTGGFMRQGPLGPALEAPPSGVAAPSKGLMACSKGLELLPVSSGPPRSTPGLGDGLQDTRGESNWLDTDEEKEPPAGDPMPNPQLEPGRRGGKGKGKYRAASEEERASLRFNIVGVVTKIGGKGLYLIAGDKAPEGCEDVRPIPHGSRRELMQARATLDTQSRSVRELDDLAELTEGDLRRRAWKKSKGGREYVVRRLLGKKLNQTEKDALGSACMLLSQSQEGETEDSAPESQVPLSEGPARPGDWAEGEGSDAGRCLLEVIYEVPKHSRRPQRQSFTAWSLPTVVNFMARVEKWLHDAQCSICQDDVDSVVELCKTEQCGHIFHRGCLLHWLKSSNSCPTCRARIPVFEGAAIEHRNLQPDFDEDVVVSEYDNMLCEVCGLDEAPEFDGNHILICDKCNKGYHLECEGLTEVPAGDWHCTPCQIDWINHACRNHESRLAPQNPQRHARRQLQIQSGAQRQRAAGGRAPPRAGGNRGGRNTGAGRGRGGNGRGGAGRGAGGRVPQARGPVLPRAPSGFRPESQPSPDLGRDGGSPRRHSPRIATRRSNERSPGGSRSPLLRAPLFAPEPSEPESPLAAGRRSPRRARELGLDRIRGAQGVSKDLEEMDLDIHLVKNAVAWRSHEEIRAQEDGELVKRQSASLESDSEELGLDGGRNSRPTSAGGRPGEQPGGRRCADGDCAAPGADEAEEASDEEQGEAVAGQQSNKRQKTAQKTTKTRDPNRPRPCADCKGRKKGGAYCLSKGHQPPRAGS